ncbi:MAG: hypothetical protein IKG59_01915 [Firmicutes bacterium]|nr:hypothetical protein [Bacillota bacterium]
MERVATIEVDGGEKRRLISKGEGYAQIKAVVADPTLDDASQLQRIRDVIRTHDELMEDYS